MPIRWLTNNQADGVIARIEEKIGRELTIEEMESVLSRILLPLSEQEKNNTVTLKGDKHGKKAKSSTRNSR